MFMITDVTDFSNQFLRLKVDLLFKLLAVTKAGAVSYYKDIDMIISLSGRIYHGS